MTVLGACWLSSFGVSSAGAQERGQQGGRFQLRWVREGGAESCVSGAALARLLEQTLGPAVAPAPPVLLEGRARSVALPARFSITIVVRDAQSGEVVGERDLTTGETKCSALTPSVLLVLAMSVDPNENRQGLPEGVVEELRRGREEDVDVWPAVAAGAPTEPKIAAIVAVAPPKPIINPRVDDRARRDGATPADETAVTGAFAVSAQVLPDPATGVSLGARLPLPRAWSLSVTLLGWLPQSVPLKGSPYLVAESVELNAAQLGLDLCRSLYGDRVRLNICGGVSVGARWVSATALANRINAVRAFYGPELGLEPVWRLAPSWFIVANVTGSLALRRDRFTYANHFGQTQPFFEPSRWSGRALLGLGARL